MASRVFFGEKLVMDKSASLFDAYALIHRVVGPGMLPLSNSDP
jgi:hypothetical protein